MSLGGNIQIVLLSLNEVYFFLFVPEIISLIMRPLLGWCNSVFKRVPPGSLLPLALWQATKQFTNPPFPHVSPFFTQFSVFWHILS